MMALSRWLRLRHLISASLLLTACHSVTDVERRNWPAINGANGEIIVRMQDGARFGLDSFVFNRTGLVGIRGTRVMRGEPRSRITTPVTLAYDDIGVVQLRRLNKQKTALAIAGAAAAGYIVIALSQNGEVPDATARPPAVSCPFIYSFDGRSWRLDSETYAGAIAKGLERSDVDNLDHIEPLDGRYRVALANEVNETDYTDQLALVAAEHPVGTRVFPDASGKLHVVGAESMPVGFREQLAVSIPAKTIWNASFRRPQGNRFALVLRVRNSEAVPFVHLKLMNLLGRDVYSWYRSVNSDPVAASRVSSWFNEMAGLRVSAADGGVWRQQAVLPVVGPVVAKTFVIPIELVDTGRTVRVRLESSPMLWEIESSQLVSEQGAPEIRELELLHATDADGQDVASSLRSRDGSYHVATGGTRVVLEFGALEPRAGMTHTVLARTTGHYYANSTDSLKGNPALVTRLMKPGAFSQAYFMLHYLRRAKT